MKVYPDKNVLMPRNTRLGKLGMAFNSYVNRYERQFGALDEEDEDEEMESSEDESEDDQMQAETEEETPDENEIVEEMDQDEQQEDEHDEGIVYLRSAVVTIATRPVILRYLDETREYRRNKVLEGSLNYFFDIFRHDPRVSFSRNLMLYGLRSQMR